MDKIAQSENNKRIAQNTLFLYSRSIIVLCVGLYASREVLAQLGIEDYGIYNVVGGVIVLFSFIQTAMQEATRRFFTFDLGLGIFDKLEKTFSLSIVIHIITACIILILCETAGLWFLRNKLVIPPDRLAAANIVYHFSVISACVGILMVPYTVAIVAHERMKVLAYAGFADAAFKLLIALSLGFAPFDKLEFYAILLLLSYVIMLFFYIAYCRRHFPETRFKWFWDKRMFAERVEFSAYTALTGISWSVASQGVNMLLNIFHGVVANAAFGIMTVIGNSVTKIANDFLMAVNPPITKSYAQGDMGYLYRLLLSSIRFSFLLSVMIVVPFVLNMDFILSLWLKDVPDNASVFCQIIVIDWAICMFVIPLGFAIISTGKIRSFVITDSILICMNLVLSYIFLSQRHSPIVVPCIHLFVNILRCAVHIFFSKKLYGLSIRVYFHKVVLRLLPIVAISVPLPILISSHTKNWLALFATSTSFIIPFLLSSIFWGLDKSERLVLFNFLRRWKRC